MTRRTPIKMKIGQQKYITTDTRIISNGTAALYPKRTMTRIRTNNEKEDVKDENRKRK